MNINITNALNKLSHMRESTVQEIEKIILGSLSPLQISELDKLPKGSEKTLLRCISEMVVDNTTSKRFTMHSDFYDIFSKQPTCIQQLNNACKDIFSVVLKDPSSSGERFLRVNLVEN